MKKKIIFLQHGETAALNEDGGFIEELQRSWLELFTEFMESKGYNPEEFIFEFTSFFGVELQKQPDGGWKWRIVYEDENGEEEEKEQSPDEN